MKKFGIIIVLYLEWCNYMTEYVQISEDERQRTLKSLSKKIDKEIVDSVAMYKRPSKVREALLDHPYTDFMADGRLWVSDEFNAQRNGLARPEKAIGRAQEGYRVRCSQVYKAVERVNLIMTETDANYVYFHVLTPDQPTPRRTYVGEDIRWAIKRKQAYLRAGRRNNKLEREFYDL